MGPEVPSPRLSLAVRSLQKADSTKITLARLKGQVN